MRKPDYIQCMATLERLSPLDRPREKLLARGPRTLSELELLAAFLGHGTKKRGVLELARDLLELFERNNTALSIDQLSKLYGVGQNRAIQIAAAQEFFRRRIRPWGIKITSPSDVQKVLGHLAQHAQECFICISLSGSYELIGTRVVTVGLRNRVQVHAREVFSEAIVERAFAIILAHNHPDGRPFPSEADIKVTRSLREAGKLLGIPVLDHIIFNHTGYYSLLEHRQGGFSVRDGKACDELAVYHTLQPAWPELQENLAEQDQRYKSD